MTCSSWRREQQTQRLLSLPTERCFRVFCPVSRNVFVHIRLDVGRTTLLELNPMHAEELRDLGLLRRPTPSPTPTTASRPERRRYKWRERKQKRGKRGGIRARLAANPNKPAIPTIVLANVRNLKPYCSLLYTSLPAKITTIGVRHLMICTSTSVGSRQPTQMLFSSWLGISTTQT